MKQFSMEVELKVGRFAIVSLVPLMLLILSIFSSSVFAKCSRSISVPMPSTGFTASMKDGKLKGITPTYLDEIGAQIGCQFVFSYVPKSRSEHLFESGQSDVMFITNQTSKRDQFGMFVPMLQIRPTIISFQKSRAPLESLKNLLADSNIKVIVVRGHNYGDEYQTLLDDLQRLDRVVFESDPLSVIKMLRKNPDWVSIMGPTIFIGVLKTDPSLADFRDKMRYEAIEEFSWTDSGMYISKKALSTQDQQYLFNSLNTVLYREKLWNAFKQYFDNEEMHMGIRKKR